jgi:EAL domain-containing protein (putative c-di-GMP-specific phosphodiesterase class I)
MSLEYLVDDKFLESMDRELAGWRDPVARLKQALDKDEFTLYCQPIVALNSSPRFPMGEVLVRLREEEKALLPPGEFLPVFEHHGMMPQLDRWVTKHVVQRLASGSRLPRFTINVSGQTLYDAQFPGFVAETLKAAKVAPASVLFEIDESDVLGRLEAAARFGAALKAIGCGVLIDGFGRRSASFAPLKTLRVDFIKVDGSVVRKILAHEGARTKMSAIVRVGDTLHIGVVAECVEEQDVLARLKAMGVGYAQGFGVYQPQPIDTVAAAPPGA